GGVAAAALVYVEALHAAGQATRHFAEGVHAENRRMASYNVGIAAAENQLNLHEMQRRLQFARATETTSVTLTHAVDSMRDAWQGFDQFARNARNVAGATAAGGSEAAG